MEGVAPRYRAFISYCHRDAKAARWLHQAIETYRVPRAIVGDEGEWGVVERRLGLVFRDEEELAGAAELGPKLETALRESGALIVIASPAAAKSRWVDHEIRFFKQIHPDRPVLAVIAEGTPDDCFPESLRFGVTPDGEVDRTDPIEPLAPDLQKQDKDSVKLKLIAGLLGVGYNELVRRDLRRQRRQMALFGALGTSVLIVMAVLSVVAVGYARMAVEQRNIANENARIATEQRKLAEHNAVEAEKKAWLAQIAAETIRTNAGCAAPDLGDIPLSTLPPS